MRRLALALALLSLALTGCGGDDEGPLDAALSYLPADAPLALVVTADGDEPGPGPLLLRRLAPGLLGGARAQADLAPLLAGEAVLGIADPRAPGDGVVAALPAEDGEALARLVGARAERIGEEAGAALYRARGGSVLAVDGDVLLVAGDEARLRAALRGRDGDDRLRAADLEDLPGDAPRVIGRGGELRVAVRDPARLAAVARALLRAAAPRTAARLERLRRGLARAGVDVDRDLLGRVEEAALALGRGGRIAVRAELDDPAAAARTLARLLRALPGVAPRAGLGDVGVARPVRGFAAIAAGRGDGVVLGVVDGVLVLSDDPARAARLARDRPREVEGAAGTLVVRGGQQAIARALPPVLRPALRGLLRALPPAGLTASLAAADGGLRGRLVLELG